jgi:hypothetical protein
LVKKCWGFFFYLHDSFLLHFLIYVKVLWDDNFSSNIQQIEFFETQESLTTKVFKKYIERETMYDVFFWRT